MQPSVISRITAPSDLSQISMAIVIGNQVYGVPAIELSDAFGFQPLDSDLTAIAALTTTTYGRSLLTSVSAAALVASLGLREVLAANRTYFVNASTGSDSNAGLTSGTAFATIQKAIDVAASLDLSIYSVTISVADGTYAQFQMKQLVGAGSVAIVGNTTTPANCVISAGANIAAHLPFPSSYSVNGFRLSGSSYGFLATNGQLTFGNIEFNTTGGAQIYCAQFGMISATANYSIIASATRHIQAEVHAKVYIQSKTITLTGTPAFASAFCVASQLASVSINGNTFSGSATGSRYSVASGAVIQTAGAGATYLPGNAAGTGTNYGASPWGLYA